MRTDASRDKRLEANRAWMRERERYHRARALRLVLPAVLPIALVVLLLTGSIALPTTIVQTAVWAIGAVLYGVLWRYLIRDARRLVFEAAATDQRFRTLMEEPNASASGSSTGLMAGGPDGPVIALVGRRIDARDAEVARFPFESVGIVRDRLVQYFTELKPSAVVCSAACGADLLALDAAQELRIRRRVILPFDRQQFRHSSVTDRPGNWGPLYDRVLDDLPSEDLVLLESTQKGDEAYRATSLAILDHAVTLAARIPAGTREGAAAADVIALLVWDGESRGTTDLTAGFAAEAERRGLAVNEILTL